MGKGDAKVITLAHIFSMSILNLYYLIGIVFIVFRVIYYLTIIIGIWTQSLILHQMLTFAGAIDFGNIEGNRFFGKIT